jgi:hypothetical protein
MIYGRGVAPPLALDPLAFGALVVSVVEPWKAVMEGTIYGPCRGWQEL